MRTRPRRRSGFRTWKVPRCQPKRRTISAVVVVQGRIQVPGTVRCRVAAWPEAKSVRSLSGSMLKMTCQSSRHYRGE
jgi:hypothetical protein